MVPRLRASSAVGALPRGPRADRTNRPRPPVVPERGHAGWIGSGGEGSSELTVVSAQPRRLIGNPYIGRWRPRWLAVSGTGLEWATAGLSGACAK
jgi:hypothetical protein